MSTIGLTIILAFVVIVLCVAAMGIGWLVKGKSILRPGACGRDPTKKRDDNNCGKESTCSLCEKDPPK